MHVIGWSLGGTFSVLSAADQPDLPIASLTVVGSPFDVALVPMVAPLRPLLNLNIPEAWRPVTRAYQLLGGAPKPLVRWAFQLSSVQKLVTKPLAIGKNLDDTEFLAQLEAVDRFTAGMIAYPGRTFGQLYHRFVRANGFRTGSIASATAPSSCPRSPSPVLVFAGATDGIAPIASVKALVGLLENSEEVRFEIVPGGHLGMLTGRGARRTTWMVMDEWIEQWSTREKPAKPRHSQEGPEGAGATARQIGSNPQRRYDSKPSRGLAADKRR